jgi:hypothetical protein
VGSNGTENWSKGLYDELFRGLGTGNWNKGLYDELFQGLGAESGLFPPE